MRNLSKFILVVVGLVVSVPFQAMAQEKPRALGGLPFIDNEDKLKNAEVTYCKDGKVITTYWKADGQYVKETDEKCTVDESKTTSIKNGDIKRLGGEPKVLGTPTGKVYYCKNGLSYAFIVENGKVSFNGQSPFFRERCILDEAKKEQVMK